MPINPRDSHYAAIVRILLTLNIGNQRLTQRDIENYLRTADSIVLTLYDHSVISLNLTDNNTFSVTIEEQLGGGQTAQGNYSDAKAIFELQAKLGTRGRRMVDIAGIEFEGIARGANRNILFERTVPGFIRNATVDATNVDGEDALRPLKDYDDGYLDGQIAMYVTSTIPDLEEELAKLTARRNSNDKDKIQDLGDEIEEANTILASFMAEQDIRMQENSRQAPPPAFDEDEFDRQDGHLMPPPAQPARAAAAAAAAAFTPPQTRRQDPVTILRQELQEYENHLQRLLSPNAVTDAREIDDVMRAMDSLRERIHDLTTVRPAAQARMPDAMALPDRVALDQNLRMEAFHQAMTNIHGQQTRRPEALRDLDLLHILDPRNPESARIYHTMSAAANKLRTVNENLSENFFERMVRKFATDLKKINQEDGAEVYHRIFVDDVNIMFNNPLFISLLGSTLQAYHQNGNVQISEEMMVNQILINLLSGDINFSVPQQKTGFENAREPLLEALLKEEELLRERQIQEQMQHRAAAAAARRAMPSNVVFDNSHRIIAFRQALQFIATLPANHPANRHGALLELLNPQNPDDFQEVIDNILQVGKRFFALSQRINNPQQTRVIDRFLDNLNFLFIEDGMNFEGIERFYNVIRDLYSDPLFIKFLQVTQEVSVTKQSNTTAENERILDRITNIFFRELTEIVNNPEFQNTQRTFLNANARLHAEQNPVAQAAIRRQEQQQQQAQPRIRIPQAGARADASAGAAAASANVGNHHAAAAAATSAAAAATAQPHPQQGHRGMLHWASKRLNELKSPGSSPKDPNSPTAKDKEKEKEEDKKKKKK